MGVPMDKVFYKLWKKEWFEHLIKFYQEHELDLIARANVNNVLNKRYEREALEELKKGFNAKFKTNYRDTKTFQKRWSYVVNKVRKVSLKFSSGREDEIKNADRWFYNRCIWHLKNIEHKGLRMIVDESERIDLGQKDTWLD